MTPGIQILHGDCREVMQALPDSSISSIVCDPPYELGFMGKKWDSSGIAYDVTVWRECLRVLKPGGHLLAFGGARTYHRLACAIEDAGFEIRDQIMWIYGSGFPKSLNIGKNLVGWAGWGTALKPAHEPICMARKPLVGTVAANVLQHGTGGLNIDGCRIETGDSLNGGAYADSSVGRGAGVWRGSRKSDTKSMANAAAGEYAQPLGRWPANVCHDGGDEVVALFPQSNGQQGDVCGTEPSGVTNGIYGEFAGRVSSAARNDAGSAARFFYTAKTSRFDRNDGCEGMPAKELNWSSGEQSPGTFQSPNTDRSATNHHPTVKPTDLMRWLVRLVTPEGGTVLDPFMGSGSTLKAAELEGFSVIGIELDSEYVEIARRRIAADIPLFRENAP